MARPELPPTLLEPDSAERGLLTADPDDLARRTIRAWQLFSDGLRAVDLDCPTTRSRSRSARDLVIAMGSWPDARGLTQMSDSALRGDVSYDPDTDGTDHLVSNHSREGDERVLGAVQQAADHVAEWFADPGPETALLTGSVLGPLPMGTVVHAAAFQLAVTLRDLAPAGARADEELEGLGLTALIDCTGGVAARVGAQASLTAVTPGEVVGTGARAGAWRTRQIDLSASAAHEHGPAVRAPTGLLLDLAAGRVEFARVLRQMRFDDARGLRAMAPILQDLPHLPGGSALRLAARTARMLRII